MAEIHIERVLVEEILGAKIETEALDLVGLQKAMKLRWPITEVRPENGDAELCIRVNTQEYGERQHIMPKYARAEDGGLSLKGIIEYR
ncbi:MAG TPA: hypothetical protein VGK74_02660 [Symbiobacteriaceae bacterium]|jgi:hypothetical protein